MLSGRVAISNEEVHISQQGQGHMALRRLIGYVPQVDVLSPDDLATEAIEFAACTKVGGRKLMTMLIARKTMSKP